MEQQKSNPVLNGFNKVVSAMSFIGSSWIMVLMVIIFFDVVGRGVFNRPITGVPEIVKNSIVGLTFLQLAYVLREGRHIRTTLLLDRVSVRWRNILLAAGNLFGMIIFAIIFYASFNPALKALQMGDFEGNVLRIPTFPTHFLILLGSLVMTLQYSILLFQNLRRNNSNP